MIAQQYHLFAPVPRDPPLVVAYGMGVDSTAMLIGRVIEGLSVTLIAVVAPTAISMWFRSGERGLPMGIWATWVPVGSVLMFNSAYPLAEAQGWRSLWWVGLAVAHSAKAGIVIKTKRVIIRQIV